MKYLFFCIYYFPFLVFLKNIILNITDNNGSCTEGIESYFCDFEQAIGNISNEDIIEIYYNDSTNSATIKIDQEFQIISKLHIK